MLLSVVDFDLDMADTDDLCSLICGTVTYITVTVTSCNSGNPLANKITWRGVKIKR